jgi:hypothetical protein
VEQPQNLADGIKHGIETIKCAIEDY